MTRLEERDIPLIARWNVELHEDEASPPLSVSAAAERLRRWLLEGAFRGAIFVANEEPVGYVLYGHRPAHADERARQCVYIRQFFIARNMRRQGRGTAAFRVFVRECVPREIDLALDVKASNPHGQRFWESLGFAAVGVAYELDRQPAK